MSGFWFWASLTGLWAGLILGIIVDLGYGMGVMVGALIIGAGNVLLNRRRARHALDARIDTRIAALSPARAEVEVSPRWWDATFQELVRKQIPRDPASHDGHDILEIHTYTDTTARRMCTTCSIEIAKEAL